MKKSLLEIIAELHAKYPDLAKAKPPDNIEWIDCDEDFNILDVITKEEVLNVGFAYLRDLMTDDEILDRANELYPHNSDKI